ncbi:MAG TPA: DUF262 and DUF1524 domain-containing protein [Bacteroidales bacterium]|jgi:uncharacterized protein with ParB-like and HNH nuclease domain/predicted transport protein|nr:DUF262 and DUF1524 domain-containing protein [Bacteroidales bacterium]HQB26202.1 DUF262 and DUF1524 domain-containing protein [Bacteroidales bacterium]
MKATEANLLEFIKKSSQFSIPIYQRLYSWTENECERLWNDIMTTGKSEIPSHFIGSIMYIEKGMYHISEPEPLLVIDGQQRLTTVSLLLEVLARKLGNNEIINGFSGRKIREYYLINPLENGERKYKLLLSQNDRSTYISIIEQKDYPKDYSLRIKYIFEYFTGKVDTLSESEIKNLCYGLLKLFIVDISLNRDNDNPQLIFESMNSTGKDLSQADLIRNFMLMRLDIETQKKLYEDYWRPMEIEFGQEAYTSYFDSFMRHYLTMRTGSIPNISEVYEEFKKYFYNQKVNNETELKELKKYAIYFCAMALDKEEDKKLKEAFSDLRDLKVDVSYPLLLELYNDYTMNILSKDDFIEIIRLIESYVFRRAVCGIPTNSLNKTFASFSKSIKKEKYLESVKAYFNLMTSYRRFPNDEEFATELKYRDLYNFRSRTYWLRRLENYDRKERVNVSEYTIEHILPQNTNLNQDWVQALGPDWQKIQQKYVHTIGNLTLTGYNAEYSDKFFTDKRDMKGGFKESPLKLNRGLSNLDTWNEEKILQRAESLSKEALNVWKYPSLDQNIIEQYRKKEKPSTEYSIDSYEYLHETKIRNLFEKLRNEILSLDPEITEEYLKLYIAYKLETNIIDVVPQKDKLKLYINIRFGELHDSKGLCRNVSQTGHWGNGDVELFLSSVDEIDYVISLVRQAIEKQFGNEES